MKGGLHHSPKVFPVIKEKRAHQQIGQRGFTIVETLIVLAVSGVMFIAIATAIAGRQRDTEFSQSVQSIKSQVQQFISEVNTGSFTNSGTDFTCQVTSGTLTITAPPSGTPIDQGANQGCIFVGKVLHFTNTGSPQTLYGYSIAGKQIDSSGDAVDTIDRASPVVLADGTTAFNNEIQNFTLQYDLKVAYVCYGDCVPAGGGLSPIASSQTGSLAFVSLGANAATGSQTVNLLPITNITGVDSNLSNPTGTESTQINNFFKNGNLVSLVNPTGGAHVCFVGGNGNSAILNIGASGDALAVTVDIKQNATCT
jgi:prepilin-type N-terminal cleavage/methylation domain-containing protein